MAVRTEGAKEVGEEAASSAAMSRARQTSEVRGIRCCRVACCAEVMRSHSRARACARRGLDVGMVTISLVDGCRRGRESRWIWYLP